MINEFLDSEMGPGRKSKSFENKSFGGKNREEKIKLFLKIAFIVFSTSGFVCFVAEEAMQMTTFGAFAYSSAKDWNGLAQHVIIMKDVHQTSELIIKGIGWMNPIMFPAYLSYLKTNEAYIRATESRVRARQ